MKKILLVVIALVAVLGGGAWWYFGHVSSASTTDQAQQNQPPYAVPALTQSYTNTAYKFTLKMPADFTVSDIPGDPDGTPETIVLQDQSGNGIQIAISPFDEDTTGSYTLTQARILQDVPDLTITDPQPIEVGDNYTGLAFKSDNEAFGGASREVWFVFRGNLYQISTYERLDDLLKGIFQTWQFQ